MNSVFASVLSRLALGGLMLSSFGVAGCTVPHSKQALGAVDARPPSDSAVFVSEEDSGLSLFGAISLSEPDHYAVLLERARRRHGCTALRHAQLDYYSDHWLIVAFPIARVTLVCERGSPSRRRATPAGSRAAEGSPR